jgi:hypothetical protein
VKPGDATAVVNVTAVITGPHTGQLRCNPSTSVPTTLKVGTSQTSQQMAGNAITSQFTDKGLEIFSGNVIPATSLIVNSRQAANVPQELQNQVGSQLSRSMLLPYGSWGRFDVSDDVVLCRPARSPEAVPPAKPAPVQDPAGTKWDDMGNLVCNTIAAEIVDLDKMPRQAAPLNNDYGVVVQQVKDGLLLTASPQVFDEKVSSLIVNNGVGTELPPTFGDEDILWDTILLTHSGYGNAQTLTLCR